MPKADKNGKNGTDNLAAEVAPSSCEIIPAHHSRLKLRTIDDCRKEAAKIYRLAKSGRIATQDASRLVFILTAISKMIEVGGMEARIIALEEEAQQIESRTPLHH